MAGIQAFKLEFAQYQTYIWLSLSALVLYVLSQPLINYLRSPLRGISLPGPTWAKYSSFPLLLKDLAGYRHALIHELHKKYGPVVQIGPEEISFSSIAAIKDIYNGPNACEISPFYDRLGNPGQMFVSHDPIHAQKKKNITHMFSMQSMKDMEPLMHRNLEKWYGIFVKNEGKPVNVLHYNRMLNLDIAGEAFFGKAFGALEDDPVAMEYAHMIDFTYLHYALRETMGLFLKFLILLTPILRGDLHSIVVSSDKVDDYADKTVTSYVERYGKQSGRRDLLTKMLMGDPRTNSKPLTDKEIRIEVTGLTFAAVDTTANVASYLFYELSCNQDWQDKIRAELLDAKVEEAGFSYQAVKDLPILNACLLEVLRFHPPAIDSLPRITHPEGQTIAGIALPGNVHISTQPYTTQRDPAIFPNPDKWDPQRWLVTEGEFGTQDMKDATMVWGQGRRMCMGKNMANVQMRIAAATLFSRLRVRLADSKVHEDMEHTGHFALIAKGKKCMIVFERV